MGKPIPKADLSAAALLLLGLGAALSLAPALARCFPAQRPSTEAERQAFFQRIAENQKRDDAAMDLFERVERTETRKVSDITQPAAVKVVRAFPVGTWTVHIPLGLDGKPADEVAYRQALNDLEHSLVWAAQDGSGQRDSYAKIAKRRKDRNLLIDATTTAFLFTWVDEETRGGRVLTKYRMVPNPAYKATSRATAIFAKVDGYLWIDLAAAELARIEVQVYDDISIGGILAKIYKGSHFMQERYEVEPGIWLPSYSQNDLDGRKFFSSFALHERILFTQYHRVGPPAEAVAIIRAELGKLSPASGDP